VVNGGEEGEERVGSPFAGMDGVYEVALGLGRPALALASGGGVGIWEVDNGGQRVLWRCWLPGGSSGRRCCVDHEGGGMLACGEGGACLAAWKVDVGVSGLALGSVTRSMAATSPPRPLFC
jgi:hypothetical protein